MRKLLQNEEGFILLIFGIIFIIGVLFLMFMAWYFITHMVDIGIGLTAIMVPIFLMIVGAVLVKKYLIK